MKNRFVSFDFSEKTLKSLLEDPLIADVSKDAIRNMDLSKEEYYNRTLKEIADEPGWKNPGQGLERLFEIASRGKYCYRLYEKDECAGDEQKESVSIVYFPSDDKAAGERPFIFLIPGGGLVNVWNLTEGWPIARIFNEMGYDSFILTYQVDVPGAAIKDMEDISRAFRIINDRKEEFGVDPGKYITCGFSAGGYVAGLWNTDKGYGAYNIAKPVASILVYPVTSYRILQAEDWTEEELDKEEFAMDTVGCSMEEACNSSFEIPEHAEGFPPTAIFVTDGDETVDPDHSKNLAKAITQAGIPCRLEVKPGGWHGFSDGKGMCMEGWPERAIEWISNLSY